MRDVLGLRGEPVMTRVFRWPGGTPQLEVGHLERMARGRAGGRRRPRALPDRRRRAQHRASPTRWPTARAPARRRRRGAASGARRRARRGRVVALAAERPGRRGAGAGRRQRRRRLGRARAGLPLAFDWSQPWRQEPVSGASGSGFLIDGRAHRDERPRDRRRAPDPGAPPRPGEPLRGDARGGGQRLRPRGAARRRPRLRAGPAARSPSARCRARARASAPTASRSAGRTSRRPPASSRASSRAATSTAAPTRTSWSRRTPRSTPATAAGPVVQDGRVVGVAFQGFPGADNMGFFIPVPDRPPLPRQPGGRALRRLPRLGPRHDAAALPGLPPRARPARGALRASWSTAWRPAGRPTASCAPGDVLLAVGGQAIANDGTIRLGDARVTFEHAIDMLQVGAPVRFTRVARRPGAGARRRRRAASRATTATGTATASRPTTSSTPASSSCGSRWSC